MVLSRSPQALFFASTYHHLLMCQAVVDAVRDGYDEIFVLWFGRRSLSELSDLVVLDGEQVEWLDFHGAEHARFKLWRSGGQRLLRSLADRLDGTLAPRLASPLDVYLGNDNQLFPQAVLDLCGLNRVEVTLFEEGLGFYLGSRGFRRHLERAAVNLLLRMRGHPYREFHRDFSLNPRIRRFACNYPGFLDRADATVLETRESYRGVVERAARQRSAGPQASGDSAECLYVSTTYSEARMMTASEELRLLEDIHRAATRRLAPLVRISFHPNEGAEKRRAALGMGYVEATSEGPLEVAHLMRPWRHILTLRSSVMINLPILEPDRRDGFWLIRSDRSAARRLHGGRATALFDHVRQVFPSLDYFDLDEGT